MYTPTDINMTLWCALHHHPRCTLRFAEGTVPSTGASRATWRVLPYISPNLSHQRVGWIALHNLRILTSA